ncbi:DUF2891 family protein [Nitritalea halalkaliphila]|uniref:DUF2891 family protein n=1 Tax=Nitritalea halalkaliphila TaxID=590849 RepID=UPI0002E11D29|nr:DUF2891 family protein [Nitritalea halalkaliphila]
MAQELQANLAPLTQLIVDKYRDFLPKLVYPVRSGEHPNTAFGLSLAYDYARTAGETALAYEIEKHAKRFFYTDQDCPLAYEPSGYDFLSPCFQTLDLMRKVLDPSDFNRWSKSFLPALYSPDFSLEVAEVSDRADGKLVHLDGLNFSRAWCLYGLVKAQPEALAHLLPIADAHVRQALPELVDENYEGTHWLGSFALYALLNRP